MDGRCPYCSSGEDTAGNCMNPRCVGKAAILEQRLHIESPPPTLAEAIMELARVLEEYVERAYPRGYVPVDE